MVGGGLNLTHYIITKSIILTYFRKRKLPFSNYIIKSEKRTLEFLTIHILSELYYLKAYQQC